MMKTAVTQLLLVALLLGPGINVHAAPDTLPMALHEAYDTGVEAYRNGDYEKAFKYFRKIVKDYPDSQEGQYYYAITLAQLGRFREAREAYETVIRLDPGGEAAALARQGMEFLPSPNKLDGPPRFKPQQPEPVAQTQSAPAAPPQQSAPQQQAAQSPFGGMDPQMMQMMMMMGSMGGGGGGGFNPMMIPIMQSMMRRNAGMPDDPEDNPYSISPDVMSTMMMNQMLQDFSPFGSGKND